MMAAPYWLEAARAYAGTREIPGPRNSPTIAIWLRRLRAAWSDDATPWCGVFMAAVFDEVGVAYPRDYARARSWLEWGAPVPLPVLGCVVVFERGPQAGHVGLVAGAAADGALLVLGGNQGDAVTLAAFPRNRVLGYRWPPDEPLPAWHAALPLGQAPATKGEA